MSEIGHNSGGEAGERLRNFVERIERLEEEKGALAADIKEVFSEAKGTGFEVKVLRALIRRRKMERQDREEFDEKLSLYEHAMLM